MDTITPIRPLIEQLPRGLHEAISTLLFSSPSWPASKCETMLTCLLHYATVQQFALEEEGPYAKIVIPNLLKIYYADRQWQQVCCYQTLHIFLRLLCALGILKKQRPSGQPTSYLLSLDPHTHFEVTPLVLAAVDRLCDPIWIKNPKMRKKASDVKVRLLHRNPLLHQNKAHENLRYPPLPPPLQQRVRRLVDSLGVSASIMDLLFEGVTEIFADMVGQQQGGAGDSVASHTLAQQTRCAQSPGRYTQGDSSCILSAEESPLMIGLGDSSFPLLDKESPRQGLFGDSSATTRTPESLSETLFGDSAHAHSEHNDAPFEDERQKESPTHTQNLRNPLPSSIDSSQNNDSFGKDLELESAQSWAGSEEDLHQEALRYLRLFDGPQYASIEYVRTHAGKKALGGYFNKIRRHPWFARVSAINTLLQRTFYDLSRQKKPLENAGKWFHASFDRYTDTERPMEITGEILDWANSSYTLEDIAHMLPLERKRQEMQWQSPEPLHRPFSSCIHLHQHEGGGFPEAPYKVSEIGALSGPPVHGMDHTEAEQLAQEINEQASWYLEQAHPRREPSLGTHVYVVEATVVGLTLPQVYTCRERWWQEHQIQVQCQVWKQQFEEGVSSETHSI